jgi:threonine dehydratase
VAIEAQGGRGTQAAGPASSGYGSGVQPPIGPDDVRSAAERLRTIAIRTPVLTSRTLDERTGVSAFLKAECFQRGGAFKLRGAYNRIQALEAPERERGVVAFSSGNHAQAVAIAARLVGTKAVIVMPSDASPVKAAATRGYGAEVVTYHRLREDREHVALRLASERGLTLVRPYDDPLVMAGQGTAALELMDEVADLDVLVVPIGGGGLVAGCATIATALRPTLAVVGVEPARADDTRRSLEAGRRVTIPPPDTIADGLAVTTPGELTFGVVRRLVDRVVTVEEEQIVDAMAFAFERMKIVVEPSGAAGIAAVLAGVVGAAWGTKVGVMVTGGNVGADRFAELIRGAREQDAASLTSPAGAASPAGGTDAEPGSGGRPHVRGAEAAESRDLVAVVDIGSNSGRVVVLLAGPGAHLEVVADGRAPLRLARDLGSGTRLSDEAIERTVSTLRDFRAVAEGGGTGRFVAVATSAIREASNGPDLVARVREVAGVDLSVIDGDQEARLGFFGAINEMPVEHGVAIDLGGGSMELTHFRDRRPARSWTLPLGSLRLSDLFLSGDPPAAKDVERLQGHIAKTLADCGVSALRGDERLIATGGTVRNLAKIDRESRAYPIPRVHGYVLACRRMEELAAMLASRKASRRRQIPGLNSDRVDSIVGGAYAILGAMLHVEAPELSVSGQGLREGAALRALGKEPLSIAEMRETSIAAMAARFGTWDAGRAARRACIAVAILPVLAPDAGPNWHECLEQAATLLDVGRSLDYYRRFEHTADVIAQGDLAGFSHRKLALLAAVVRFAGDSRARVGLYRPLLTPEDRSAVAGASAILELADEIEHRLPPGAPGAIEVEERGRTVFITAPIYDPSLRQWLSDRCWRAYRRRIQFREPGGTVSAS